MVLGAHHATTPVNQLDASENDVEVQPRAWLIPSAEEFPEVTEGLLLADSADVGVALGGGGIRASSQSLGVLKAIHGRGLLNRVRYISSNSGSSWLVAPFSFLPDSISMDTFLGGPPVDPAYLTLNTLENPPEGSFAKAAGNAAPTKQILQDLWEDWWHKGHVLMAWNDAVVKQYFEDFGLFQLSSVMAPPAGTPANGRAQVAASKRSGSVLAMRKQMPYPIMTASRLNRDTDAAGDWKQIEFTPLYSGTPSVGQSVEGIFGGGVIESFGYGSPAPESLPDGREQVLDGEEVTVTPTKFASLAFAAGTSSNAPYVDIAASVGWDEALGGATIPLWSPLDIASQNNRDTVVADGGAVDNLAVLPMLRRGVRTVFVHISETVGPNASDFDQASWWPALFGRAVTAATTMGAANLNAYAQVFESAKFDELKVAAIAKVGEGKPPIVEQTLNVLANVNCGVTGGYTVRMVWCMDFMTDTFKNALPSETSALLDRTNDRLGILSSFVGKTVEEYLDLLVEGKDIDSMFPYDTTYYGGYTTRLVSLLAENAAYNWMEGAGDILDEVLKEAEDSAVIKRPGSVLMIAVVMNWLWLWH